MSNVIASRTVITHPHFVLMCYLLLIIVLPLYGGIAVTMFGCASILTVYVAVLPQQFQTKNGSMRTAACLLAMLWLATAVITVMTLLGEIRS